MEIKALNCPQCGAALNISSGQEIAYCPHCGNKLQIQYTDQERQKFSGRPFVTTDGMSVGTAVVPDSFEISAASEDCWQSEMNPTLTIMHAIDKQSNITLLSVSRETYYDIKSGVMKGLIGMIGVHTKNGYTKFTDPDEYLKFWAEEMTNLQLTPVSKTKLPSKLGKNPQIANAQLNSEIQKYFNYLGEQYPIVNTEVSSVLYKYTGYINNQPMTVFAGMDYNGAELGSMMGNIAEGIGKVFNNIKLPSGNTASGAVGEFKSTLSNVLTGKEKMTMDEWMHGGILGKMARNKRNSQQNPQAEMPQPVRQEPQLNPDGSIPFGHSSEFGKSVAFIIFGPQRKYICLCPAEKENEAIEIFLRFVQSISPDQALSQKENMLIQQKLNAVMQEAAMNQARAQQMQMQTRQMQMQTSQMIARNSAQTSAGIMDSWNKKQAAQTRMSNNYSEAIRGVNTYVTPTGSPVEVGVSADHVYQNQYGDVFGVSGNAPDNEALNNLNWTELNKK